MENEFRLKLPEWVTIGNKIPSPIGQVAPSPEKIPPSESEEAKNSKPRPEIVVLSSVEEEAALKAFLRFKDSVEKIKPALIMEGEMYPTTSGVPIVELSGEDYQYSSVVLDQLFLKLANEEYPEGAMEYVGPAFTTSLPSGINSRLDTETIGERIFRITGVRIEIVDPVTKTVFMYLNKDEFYDNNGKNKNYKPVYERWYTSFHKPALTPTQEDENKRRLLIAAAATPRDGLART